MPHHIAVRRSADPIDMAHAYLTKVPVDAIIPFIEAFTQPGDLILDPFAGSGMAGVAAVMRGRRALLSDISVLGLHVGSNYVNLVDPHTLLQAASNVVRTARAQIPGLYTVLCSHCRRAGEFIKAVWSREYACGVCGTAFTYYRALEAANWRSTLACARCMATLRRGNLRRLGESMVLETLRCTSARRQIHQEPSGKEPPRFPALERWPDVSIEPDREMFHRSALGKRGLTSTASFFTRRNLTALVALRNAIINITDPPVRGKLLFVFTWILVRASKRQQWSHKRPLNAQNPTYGVPPDFYEWNVFDLFERNVRAVIASDDRIRSGAFVSTPTVDVKYHLTSAHRLAHVASDSVDYVFTDPPFGTNIFYSDMSLFQ
jgi:16S rRNA G966 N2-methylase RsmD